MSRHRFRGCIAGFRSVCLLTAACGLSACGESGAPDRPAPVVAPVAGKVDGHDFKSALGTNPYQVYVPASYDGHSAWPLFVMLHGCGTTADQQMHANSINELADAEKFLVLYPEVNLTNIGGCWKAIHGDVTSRQRGGGGDADVIAGITRAAMVDYRVDPERVYMIGMSAGAFQTTATAAAYPELYAAIGVNAGGGYAMNWSCAVLPDEVAPLHAQLAVDQMGEGARVIPFFAIGGDADPLGEGLKPAPGGCSRLAFLQWMATNNIVAGGSAESAAYVVDPESTTRGQVDGGRDWTRETWRDRGGCRIGERWIVHGMGHYWSGGSSDPQWAQWTDPKGPSAAVAAWEFFRHFRKSTTGEICAERLGAP